MVLSGSESICPPENSPWSLTAADFTGSGGLDLAVGVAVLGSNGAVSIDSNRPVGGLYPSSLRFGSLTCQLVNIAITIRIHP